MNRRFLSLSNAMPRMSQQRLAGIAAVAAIHAAFLYAFITGMAQNAVTAIPHLLEVKFAPPTEHVQPPPPPELPNVEVASVPEVAAPVIRIARPPVHHTITVAKAPPKAVPVSPAPAVPAVTPEIPAKAAVAPTAASGIAGTHTTPPYPNLARKLGEQGTVKLRIALDARGAVTGVTVLDSSGHARLDDAAVDWVKAHWRYRPATRDGAPVPSTAVANVVFDLRNG